MTSNVELDERYLEVFLSQTETSRLSTYLYFLFCVNIKRLSSLPIELFCRIQSDLIHLHE